MDRPGAPRLRTNPAFVGTRLTRLSTAPSKPSQSSLRNEFDVVRASLRVRNVKTEELERARVPTSKCDGQLSRAQWVVRRALWNRLPRSTREGHECDTAWRHSVNRSHAWIEGPVGRCVHMESGDLDSIRCDYWLNALDRYRDRREILQRRDGECQRPGYGNGIALGQREVREHPRVLVERRSV